MKEGSRANKKNKVIQEDIDDDLDGITTSNNNNNDLSCLHGLEKAIYILEQLCGGKEKSEVIRAIHGDKQLVDMWSNFLQHNHWVMYDHRKNEWVLTEKGKQWTEQ